MERASGEDTDADTVRRPLVAGALAALVSESLRASDDVPEPRIRSSMEVRNLGVADTDRRRAAEGLREGVVGAGAGSSKLGAAARCLLLSRLRRLGLRTSSSLSLEALDARLEPLLRNRPRMLPRKPLFGVTVGDAGVDEEILRSRGTCSLDAAAADGALLRGMGFELPALPFVKRGFSTTSIS